MAVCVEFKNCANSELSFSVYHDFSLRKRYQETKNGPGGLVTALRGHIMCVCDLTHTTGVLLDCNQIRVLRQSLRLLRSRQLDVQDAILELCVDVFLLHIAHVETACAGAGEGFAPQIAAILILFVIAVAAGCHAFFSLPPGLALFNGPVPCYNRKKRNRVIFWNFMVPSAPPVPSWRPCSAWWKLA